MWHCEVVQSLLVGTLPVWQIMHEVRVAVPTVVLASLWIAARSDVAMLVWQPSKHTSFAARRVWAVEIEPWSGCDEPSV
jgi:hypothetical protein